MKKLLLMFLLLPLSYLNAKMIYFPSHNRFGSVTLNKNKKLVVKDEFNSSEYNNLLNYCMRVVYINVKSVECNSWEKPDSKKVIQQCCLYLRSLVKTDTAKILADDFEDGFLYYLGEDQTIVAGEIISKLVKLYNL